MMLPVDVYPAACTFFLQKVSLSLPVSAQKASSGLGDYE